jgi:tRNA(Ile)-lysidine synthase
LHGVAISGNPSMPPLALPERLRPGATLVVAVSGGADSVALLDLLVAEGRFCLIAWHLDHGLRPESAADALAVQELAARLGVPAVIERADVRLLARGDGLEEAGRRARYARLAALCRARGADAACTAHHRDDQAETALLQILRGCGPEGPTGIAAERPLAPGAALLRPVLGWTRAELRAHCQDRGLAWREDASNADTAFRRNLIRHAVLPDWERHCPGVTGALVALAERGRATRTRADAQAARVHLAGGLHLGEADALDTAGRAALWRRLLARLGVEPDRERLRRLDDLARGGSGRRLRLGAWLLTNRRRRLEWACRSAASG